MAQAARLHSRTGLRPLTYSTLIGLLVATGLRPGEAISLDLADVDLVNGILSIRESKLGKSRFVPVDESTRAALERYAQNRDRLCSHRLTEAFLVGERGKRLNACSVRSMFVRMSRATGLRVATEDGRDGYGPRLQDFRHNSGFGIIPHTGLRGPKSPGRLARPTPPAMRNNQRLLKKASRRSSGRKRGARISVAAALAKACSLRCISA